MGRKTRERQLRRLRERRASERARQRRRRITAGVVGGLVGVAAVASGAVLVFAGGGGEEAAPAESPGAGAGATGAAGTAACGAERPAAADAARPTFDAPPEMEIDPARRYVATLVTSCGSIRVRLFPKDAPVTVNNFVALARAGFYDGLTFHRVIAGFMNQGGDPAGDGTGDPGYQFEDEIVDRLTFDEPGLLAMANAGPGTNGSQFFITVAPAPHLDGLHTIFGRVTGGMDVVELINGLPTDATDRPVEAVYIERVSIEES